MCHPRSNRRPVAKARRRSTREGRTIEEGGAELIAELGPTAEREGVEHGDRGVEEAARARERGCPGSAGRDLGPSLVAMVLFPFPELKRSVLMKDFYTTLFPEPERSLSGTRNMERGTWPRSTFPASMGRGVYISLRQPEPVGYEIGTVGPQTLHCSVRPPHPQVVGRSSRTS